MHPSRYILTLKVTQELWWRWEKARCNRYRASKNWIREAAQKLNLWPQTTRPGMILWTKLFLEEQGHGIKKNILYQDNKSAILLETNGRRSAGKRSRAINVRYFFLTDQVEKGNVTIQYCPTDDMWGDYMTKPLQGVKFKKFRDDILGLKWVFLLEVTHFILFGQHYHTKKIHRKKLRKREKENKIYMIGYLYVPNYLLKVFGRSVLVVIGIWEWISIQCRWDISERSIKKCVVTLSRELVLLQRRIRKESY